MQSTRPPTSGCESISSRKARAFMSLPIYGGDIVSNELSSQRDSSARTHLSQLDRQRIGAVPRLLQEPARVDKHAHDRVAVLSAWRAIRDGNHKDGLVKLACASGTENERLEDLRVECRSERRQTRELDLVDERDGFLLCADVVALDPRVHEPHLDAVVVERRAGLRDARDDELGVVDARAAFLEGCERRSCRRCRQRSSQR